MIYKVVKSYLFSTFIYASITEYNRHLPNIDYRDPEVPLKILEKGFLGPFQSFKKIKQLVKEL